MITQTELEQVQVHSIYIQVIIFSNYQIQTAKAISLEIDLLVILHIHCCLIKIGGTNTHADSFYTNV